jgi:N-acetylglutamate synthase-like GNAT family acetyltransferase
VSAPSRLARIAPFAAGDTEGVGALILGIQRGEFGFGITWADQPDLHDIPAFYRKGKGEFWVAKDGAGVIVGTISLADIGGGQGALRKMFVAKDWRGPEHRLAQRLLDGLLAHARAVDIRTAFLGTTEAFRAAHRFYEKNGFRQVAPETLPPSFPRMSGDTRFYRIDLA